jgi:drug/metabolite transporter, DME family
VSRLAYDAGMTPLGFTSWRGIFGGIVLALILFASRGRRAPLVDLRRVPRRDLLALLVAGASGVTLNLAIFVAFGRITIALALLAFYTYPAMVALFTILIERRRPATIELVALLLALAGMVLVVAGQLDPTAGLVLDALGLALAFLAAIAQTVYVLANRSYQAIPTEQVATFLVWITVASYFAIACLTGSLDSIAQPFRTPAAWPYLVWAGVVGGGLPSLLFLVAVHWIGPVRTGILAMLEPVTGTVLAAVLLGESLQPIQLAGGVLVILAGILLQRAPRQPNDAPVGGLEVPEPG